MTLFTAIIQKETKQILRDKRTLMILLGMPIVMMLLFGFALSTEVHDAWVVAVASGGDPMVSEILGGISQSDHFTLSGEVPSPKEAEDLLREGKADMAIVFSPSFSDHTFDGEAKIQFILDGSDPNTSLMRSTYAKGVIASCLGMDSSGVETVTHYLFNPSMKSSYNFVPGILGLLMLIICCMMTSVSIVREKERGSMEVLLASPASAKMITLSKAVPYVGLSVVILAMVLLISKFILGVPLSNLPLIIVISLLYIVLAVSMGLMVSVIAKKQIVALLFSGIVMLAPTMLLSGMIFPTESMPWIFRIISCAVPARWYISAMKKVMVMGVGLSSVKTEIAVLSGMAVLLAAVATKSFKERL